MRLDRLEALGDSCVGAGLDERDLPVVDIAIQKLDFPATLRPDEVVGDGLVVAEEVVLDDVALVP